MDCSNRISTFSPVDEDMFVHRDRRLVSAAQSGSVAAFAELRLVYAQQIYRKVFAITKNKEDAEDALQDTFLRAYLGLKNFQGRCEFSTWLTRIAINSSLMILRKRRLHPEVSIHGESDGNEDYAPFQFRDKAQNPEQSYDQRQRYFKLLTAIRKLAPPLRNVAELRMIRDCTLQETARMLGITEAAAKSRLYRARLCLTASCSRGASAQNDMPVN